MKIERYPKYEIFKDGSIWRFGKQLKSRINNCGYFVVFLYHNKKRRQEFVHKLLLETFKIKPDNSYNQGNHINGIKTDNSLDNLEWCNNSINQKHAYKLKLRRPHHKVDYIQSQTIKKCFSEGLSKASLARYLQVTEPCIAYHVKTNTFNYVQSK